jgi:hypothetical protein
MEHTKNLMRYSVSHGETEWIVREVAYNEK